MPKQIRTATKLQWLYNSWVAEIKILKDTDLKKKYKVQKKKQTWVCLYWCMALAGKHLRWLIHFFLNTVFA